MKAVHLQVEYLTTPLGIDIQKPRFYWNCEGGKSQKAYQIVVKKEGELLWDSGKVTSSSMTHIAYEGRTLKSREHLVWSVCLWDENDVQGEWSSSWLEMGLLEKSDWTAKWICGDYKPKKNTRYPVDYFKKEFTFGKEIKSARLYATARGVYDVTVNGTRIEEFILAPGMTDYRKRIQYQTYDVTGLLAQENCMEIRLADGWYRGSAAAYGVTNVYGSQTSVLAQLEVNFADGTALTIGTDESFVWCNDGALLFADLKDGEIYDASRKPSYAKKAVQVKENAKTEPHLAASNNVFVCEKEHFTPTILTAKDGTKVLDFGQNIAGYLKFAVQGRKGQKIRLVCGETLDKDGKVDLSGIQETRPAKGWSELTLIMKLLGKEPKAPVELTPKQEIIFLCSGEKDSYKTSFAIFGFRYVQIEGDVPVNPEAFEAIAVYSDMEQTGSFCCSNALVNQLYQNTVWSMKGNFLDLPTDCPTRERLGWTGDAQIFFDTGAYMMNTASFFRKWMTDMEDNQFENGLLSAVLPFQGAEIMYKNTGSSVGWADAVYLIPYRYYKRFGDKKVLEKYWPMMKRYTDYLMKHLGMSDKKKAKANPYNDYTYEKGVHLGEWLEPEEFRDKVYGAQAKHPEECTAYLYLAMTTVAEIAELLGESAYAATCRTYAKGAKEAYNTLFVKTGTLRTNRQTKIVRPLALGLLDGDAKAEAEALLEEAVKDYQYRVGTGFLSTPFLLPTLTGAGKAETAYKMLENTKKPSWLGEVVDGATTVWENWEGTASLNHYSPGAVCQWLFETVGGIRADGENHFVIAPVPGGTLTEAKTAYQSIYGKVETAWKKEKAGIHYTITIPANTTADVLLPDGRREVVSAGVHEF